MRNERKMPRRFGRALLALLLCAALTVLPVPAAEAEVTAASRPASAVPPEGLCADCRAALLMEAATGEVIFEKNADEPLPPASVTKIMTLLLVMEAIGDGRLSWDDELTASANAASMGGSQIFLEPGEKMTVRDLVKSVVISSANDAAVVLAEAVAGSEAAFVERMNARAAALGMTGAHFENTNGLDDTTENHVLSARDIALMSRELIRHREILTFSSTWMDSVRDGAFGLSNTNRLIRTCPGANGLKTGSTAKALFCVSATAERDGMTLIAVVMAAPTRDARNADAAALLDWGFANYSLFRCPAGGDLAIPVTGGRERTVAAEYGEFTALVPRGCAARVNAELLPLPTLAAPFDAGTPAGEVRFSLDGEPIGSVPIRTVPGCERLTFGGLLVRMLRVFCLLPGRV